MARERDQVTNCEQTWEGIEMVSVGNRGKVQIRTIYNGAARMNDKVGRRWDSENGIAWFGLQA